ncbi:TolC family protein [Tenacibaculum pacificus]|uniref:TolC family protein n=1 Tax=Tenacibaculum pacificus TaxID=3018314 RepID=UPI002FDEE0B5
MIRGQEVMVIAKSDVIAKVKENNNTLKMSAQDILMAKADYNQTNAVFLPDITASYTGIATTNPLMAFGSKLNQGILTQNDFNPDLLNTPSQTQNFATKIQVQQPLINLDGIYQRKAAKAKLNATTFQH